MWEDRRGYLEVLGADKACSLYTVAVKYLMAACVPIMATRDKVFWYKPVGHCSATEWHRLLCAGIIACILCPVMHLGFRAWDSKLDFMRVHVGPRLRGCKTVLERGTYLE